MYKPIYAPVSKVPFVTIMVTLAVILAYLLIGLFISEPTPSEPAPTPAPTSQIDPERLPGYTTSVVETAIIEALVADGWEFSLAVAAVDYVVHQ